MTTDEDRACRRCERRVETCACCERDDCADPICYRDLIYELGQSIPVLHTHGG